MIYNTKYSKYIQYLKGVVLAELFSNNKFWNEIFSLNKKE
jgi:hypothetical protein